MFTHFKSKANKSELVKLVIADMLRIRAAAAAAASKHQPTAATRVDYFVRWEVERCYQGEDK